MVPTKSTGFQICCNESKLILNAVANCNKKGVSSEFFILLSAANEPACNKVLFYDCAYTELRTSATIRDCFMDLRMKLQLVMVFDISRLSAPTLPHLSVNGTVRKHRIIQ